MHELELRSGSVNTDHQQARMRAHMCKLQTSLQCHTKNHAVMHACMHACTSVRILRVHCMYVRASVRR